MASNIPSSDSCADEDYIEIDLFCTSANSSPQSREFEFQFCLISNDEKETTNFPADELFYEGKLLPLHLSPRLEMLQKLLLQTSNNTPFEDGQPPSTSSIVHSSESPDDAHSSEWSKELRSFVHNQRKNSWSKKLKLVKNSILGQKLKDYLKSLFSKSDESSCAKAAACNVEPENLSKNKRPTDTIEIPEDFLHRRRSFSGAIQNKCLFSSSSSSLSGASSLSSSSSFNSSTFQELKVLRRSSSAVELEGSIESAIAYCKKSQQEFDSRSISGLCSFPGEN